MNFKISGTQTCITEIIKLIDPNAKLPFECICNKIGYDPSETHITICPDRRGYENHPDYAKNLTNDNYEVSCEIQNNQLKIVGFKEINRGSSLNILEGVLA